MSELVEKLVKNFISEFKSRNDPALNQKAFFVRRRSEILIKQHPNWDYWTLAGRLVTDMTKIEAWLAASVGHPGHYGPIVTGQGDRDPKHLDLKQLASDLAISTTGSGGASTMARRMKQLLKLMRHQRFSWVTDIVWRAVAIHEKLWSVYSEDFHSLLLSELVDRRLRVVEQIEYNVNGGIVPVEDRKNWTISGVQGTWKDGQLVRSFEYPAIPFDPFKDLWKEGGWPLWRKRGEMLQYIGDPDKDLYPNTLPPEIAVDWYMIKVKGWEGYFFYYPELKPKQERSHSPSVIFEKLFTPNEDFRQRSWLHCDQVAAAVNIEALRFALLRREGNDNLFDKVCDRKKGYVRLDALLDRSSGPMDIGVLMADGGDHLYFENRWIDVNDLQIGDHLVFYNTHIYDLLASGFWRNEFSFVMDICIDPNTGWIIPSKLKLAGHGIQTVSYPEMVSIFRWKMVIPLNFAISIIERLQNPDLSEIALFDQLFVRWAPYGESFNWPGAWWLRIPKAIWHDRWKFDNSAKAVESVPRTVRNDPDYGKGYRPPPGDDDSIFFPLYMPSYPAKDGDSWNAYLEMRRQYTNPAPKSLVPITLVDKHLAPGLSFKSKSSQVAVIRPQVTLL